MNGAHDMGGMEGLGPLAPEAGEPVFHHRWEARVLALNLAAAAHGRWNIDVSRHARERIPGPDYLAMSYYERWLAGLETLLRESGLVNAAELQDGRADTGARRLTPPLTSERVPAVLANGGPTLRQSDAPPRFKTGDLVRARMIQPHGHTRLPRYVRGRLGTIEAEHGAHVLPDANAHGRGEQPERLYGVVFTSRELWGEAADGDQVRLDLWESYLDAA